MKCQNLWKLIQIFMTVTSSYSNRSQMFDSIILAFHGHFYFAVIHYDFFVAPAC